MRVFAPARERRAFGYTDLQKKVTEWQAAITCDRPDLLEPEIQRLQEKLRYLRGKRISIWPENLIEDVLHVCLVPRCRTEVWENRRFPAAFEPVPNAG